MELLPLYFNVNNNYILFADVVVMEMHVFSLFILNR
jgi:hypothetical protein